MSNEMVYCPRCKDRVVAVGYGSSIKCSVCDLIGTPNIKWQDFEQPESDVENE